MRKHHMHHHHGHHHHRHHHMGFGMPPFILFFLLMFLFGWGGSWIFWVIIPWMVFGLMSKASYHWADDNGYNDWDEYEKPKNETKRKRPMPEEDTFIGQDGRRYRIVDADEDDNATIV